MTGETHQLVVDTYGFSFSIQEDTEKEILKSYKSWRTKVFGSRNSKGKKTGIVKIPTIDGLPAEFRVEAILGLRVIRIPEDELARRRIMTDPKNRHFVDNASAFQHHTDLLDNGRWR